MIESRTFDRNAVILGVSFDSTEANRRFREKQGFPFDLLSDLDKRASIAYGVATPRTSAPRAARC